MILTLLYFYKLMAKETEISATVWVHVAQEGLSFSSFSSLKVTWCHQYN